MKKIFYSLCFVLILGAVSGCKKFLDQQPLNSVPNTEFFKSLKDINSALAGMYASLQQDMTGTGTGFTGFYFQWGELRSDNFDDNGQYSAASYKELSQNALTSGNTSANWTGFYRTIGRCNTAIKYIPQAASYDANATPTVVNNALAQCYAMRAFCYFNIIRIWGDPVVWTEPYADVSQPDEKPRSAKDSVLKNLVIPDLEKAYSLMQKNQTPTVWSINEAAICAIAADVYMWKSHDNKIQPDYNKAIAWIQNLFKAKAPNGKVFGGTSGADLEPTASWKNLFLDPSKTRESIWSIHWDNTVNGCACLPVTVGLSNNQARFDSTLQADWKKVKADIRMPGTIDTLNGLGHNDKLLKYFNMSGVFSQPAGTQPTDLNVYLVMYRLGDVYLTYAEALNKTGDLANALKYLNFIRVRAGLTAYAANDPAVSAANMENTILNERRFELYGEGKRWFDLVRTGKVMEVMDPVLKLRQARLGTAQTGFGSDVNKILWPLYRTLLEDNKKLVQNPSYN
ncbi:RagB/SusD family nutrient uptake outer membrane protein [Flavisolibacter ginsenosidimutans]|uniref:RagB/SusD family nutrient uptake outer membrane protein n=1 Tax=Flavisolibacter ginsenosidimutans TaxID=661481 RepID=A0A5B8UHM6_9BACT|nr:RagB/SusD family nutrient uptake outer membrane protein [Flavisolibacter ginsenosidimutans]QEC56144.1 RagB/SusD family nutrient uptake outer membrane protein [Flavisolibacter ginsenosidimutans]